MSSSSRVPSQRPSTWLSMAALCMGSTLLCLLFAFSVRAANEVPAASRPASKANQTERSGSPRRIISLVPSLTETLFVLGLEDRLVGITDFCEHLPEARRIPSIGSCLEPGIEAIAARSPDLILYGPDQEQIAGRLGDLGFRTASIRQIALADIPLAIRSIGDLCGVAEAAASVTARFRQRLEAVTLAVAGRPRPRALLVVGRDISGGRVEQAYVAAPGSYHDDLLRIAGADNAWRGQALNPYPVVTQEGLMSLNPDMIIDLVPDPDRQPGGFDGLKAAWKQVPALSAAASDRVFLLTGTQLSIPGPRSAAEAAEQLSQLLHPGATPSSTASHTTENTHEQR